MKLYTYIENNMFLPAVEVDGEYFQLFPHIEAFDYSFFEHDGINKIRQLIANGLLPKIVKLEHLGPPITKPSKIVCVGLNYNAHIQETDWEKPTHPILFLKSPSALCGPFDPILIPPGATQVDWEVELAVIIGKKAKRVHKSEALEYVAGYTIINDVSERFYQKEMGGQWSSGKCFDHFAPMGPCMVTKDEIDHPENLFLTTKVNGQVMQLASTQDMIFKLDELIAYISSVMTLLPGDIIATGTPQGVAMGRPDKPYLRDGDVVEQTIECIGTMIMECHDDI